MMKMIVRKMMEKMIIENMMMMKNMKIIFLKILVNLSVYYIFFIRIIVVKI